jgi:hypothetical protein
MPRKNNRITFDTYLPPIKEEDDKRALPICPVFPAKTLFTTGWRAQVAVDEINAHSNRDKKPKRVYECKTSEGGCGYFHTTSQDEYESR